MSTDALARVKKRKVRVHVVAVVRKSKMGKSPGAEGIPPCDSVRLITYS